MRLDAALVERGLARSRQVARELVEAGEVRVNAVVLRKPSKPVESQDVLTVASAPRYVGRGGLKLEAALHHFNLSVEGLRCLDVGASTGGFTDCLLQHGAASVVAVDVGHGQLVESLKRDDRVTSFEGVNIRHTPPVPWEGTFDAAVVDVSFISLRLVLPKVMPWVDPGGWLVALVKPQFEAGAAALDHQGVVRDPKDHDRAVAAVRAVVDEVEEWAVREVVASPILGGEGNQEFLLLAQRRKNPSGLQAGCG